MHRRARSILRGEQGLSMILVLCIGALFVALSAALAYAASVLTANANRQLLEQEAYQLATSFSDVLEGELTLETETASYTLHPGDSLGFASSVPHTYHNRQPEQAVFLCINYHPNF